MNWRERYKDKIVTAEEAVKCIKSGDLVVPHHVCSEPQKLVEAMVARVGELENVRVMNGYAVGACLYAQPGMEKSFKHISLFGGPGNREALRSRRADFLPCYFHEMPRLFREELPVDVLMITICPPDENGQCSFGLSADYSASIAKTAKTVIAEINSYLPRTYGASVSIEDIDFLVENNEPPMSLPETKIGELEYAIARHIAPLIPDEATLQLGIGTLPDAVLSFLKDKKDLGIHTEVLTDSVIDLYREGIITNRKKTIYQGKFVTTTVLGSNKLYEFVDNNPDVLLLPVDITNNPSVIAQNSKMISINSAIQVDLMGQICAEAIGGVQFSGVGGQVDFVRGVSASTGGISVITLPSTAAKGMSSRIVCRLDPGSPVTTNRCDVNYVATEYGIVNLRPLSLRERAKALINIAHPDFRELLTEEAKRLSIL